MAPVVDADWSLLSPHCTGLIFILQAPVNIADCALLPVTGLNISLLTPVIVVDCALLPLIGLIISFLAPVIIADCKLLPLHWAGHHT